MSSAYFCETTFRLTFMVGVISPVSSEKSSGRMRTFLMASALETVSLAAATALLISASRSGSLRRSVTVADSGLPLAAFHCGKASGSMVTSAAM